MENTANLIVEACRKQSSTNPIEIFNNVAKESFVRMHGPEHHVLDGAALLTAFKNAGGNIDLDAGYAWVKKHGLTVPGAACAHWGICGAVISLGTALSFIDGTSPLSTDGTWGKHMLYTSKAAEKMGTINGPRCCKRDAYISYEAAIDYINENYNVKLDKNNIECDFSSLNMQCIGEKCPYHTGRD